MAGPTPVREKQTPYELTTRFVAVSINRGERTQTSGSRNAHSKLRTTTTKITRHWYNRSCRSRRNRFRSFLLLKIRINRYDFKNSAEKVMKNPRENKIGWA